MFNRPSDAWAGVTPRQWQIEALDAVLDHYLQPDPEPALISAIMGAGKSVLLAELCAAFDGEVVVSTSTQMLVRDLQAAISMREPGVGVWYAAKKERGRRVTVVCNPSLRTFCEDRGSPWGVGLWIPDEAHRTECASILEPQGLLQPQMSLGLTATAFRSDRWEALTLFEKVLYRYGVREAIRDGVVVPWQIVNARRGGDLDDCCIEMVLPAAGAGICNAVDIADADHFAGQLNAAGIGAAAVHSQLGEDEVNRRMRQLRDGDLRAVVHVNMLSEGVNYPWLAWMLLRREVGARVRFVQEVGRLLRSHPGKERAVFYDPHDLFGTFRLTYAEALGEPPPRPEAWAATQRLEPLAERAAEQIREADPPIAMAWIESVVRGLVIRLEVFDVVGSRRILKKLDRVRPSTPMQHAALRTLGSRVVEAAPPGWRACLKSIGQRPELLRFGFAADLIVSLEAISQTGEWPDA